MKKISVTIGIPAYNEEQNISHLLKRLLGQKETFFSIKKILIISDAATDATDTLVQNFLDNRIDLVRNSSREGQTVCQNSIFEKANTDVVVLFEGDTLPSGRSFLERILRPILTDTSVNFTYSNIMPMAPVSFIGSALLKQYSIYHSMYMTDHKLQKNFASGRSARVFTKKVYTKLRWPKDVPEDVYALLWLVQHGYSMRFVRNAVSFFRYSETVNDFLNAFCKIHSGRRALENYFSKKAISNRYNVPLRFTLSYLVKFFIFSPISFMIFIFLRFYSLFVIYKSSYTDLWKISPSTKKVGSL